jgi:hypothetical protein
MLIVRRQTLVTVSLLALLTGCKVTEDIAVSEVAPK